MSEVLRYVQFDPEELLGKLRRDVEAAVHAGQLQDQQAGRLLKFYEEGLQGTRTWRTPRPSSGAPRALRGFGAGSGQEPVNKRAGEIPGPLSFRWRRS